MSVLACTFLKFDAHSLPVSQQVNSSTSATRSQDARLFLRDEELERAVGLLMTSERRLNAAAHDARKAAGLNPAAFQAMMAIRADPGLSVTALRRHLGATVPTMARTLGALDKAGLIERPRSHSDGRKRRLVLSASGQKLTEPATTAMRDVLRAAFRQAGAEKVAGALAVLEALKHG